MTSLILCCPGTPCPDRNRCIRYRKLRDRDDRIADLSHERQPNEPCRSFSAIFDTDDDLAPEDWQDPAPCARPSQG